MRVVDSHLHLWDLGRRTTDPHAYPWLTPDWADLHRDHLPDEARTVLDAAGVDQVVLVQAEDSTAETDLLLEWADQHPWIVGVVGWLPLLDPAATAEELARLAHRPLVGVRHLVHDDPDAEFLDHDQVRASLSLVAAAGLPLDVPDAWPRHLDQLTRLASDLPALTVVVDHLAKPPRSVADARRAMASWQEFLATAAALPNVVAKVSGLQAAGASPGTRAPLTTDDLTPVLDTALELFGSNRLMYGSDWPMTTRFDGGYAPHLEAIRGWAGTLSSAQQDDLWHATACRVYRLG
ncbi:amidohydrolase family protein [Aestuariimicrobium kwangyangense]|uniref:amidohydrolase family protein n=1 Tax=Aestuariimicrobium kwangyangense TaxID=396389 RepID=UPI0003B37640|nr:amidohydrolase family protein [Aestuariimicrobium kwangyangense]